MGLVRGRSVGIGAAGPLVQAEVIDRIGGKEGGGERGALGSSGVCAEDGEGDRYFASSAVSSRCIRGIPLEMDTVSYSYGILLSASS